jgi:ferrous iron transport protein A
MDAYTVDTRAFPLRLARQGELVRIVSLQGGAEFRRKLTELGLAAGSEIRVVQNGGSGALVVALANMRIGIGAGMAHRVLVTAIDSGRE